MHGIGGGEMSALHSSTPDYPSELPSEPTPRGGAAPPALYPDRSEDSLTPTDTIPHLRPVRVHDLAPLRRHNARVGTLFNLCLQRLVMVVLLGPISFVAVRVLFRVRFENRERLDVLRSRGGFYALRHFYEWDPFLHFFIGGYAKAITSGSHFLPTTIANASVWMRTRPMRMLSFCFGLLGLTRGAGTRQPATERALELLASSKRKHVVAICPSGPIGKRRRFTIAPGIGHLALARPDLPVVPITLVGLQEISLRDVLTFKRPTLTLSICRPFYGGEARGGSVESRLEAVCALVGDRWAEEEARLGVDPLERTSA